MATEIQVTPARTPNPHAMRFEFSQSFHDQTIEFTNVAETTNSPLASKIFGFPWTSHLLLGPNFLTVTKQDWVEWDILAEPLAGLISEHLNQGEPVLFAEQNPSEEIDANDSEIVKKLKIVLNREIRPVVALDGGDIQFFDFKDGRLYLKMRGACASCPSSAATLKDGIETRLKELFTEVVEVVGV